MAINILDANALDTLAQIEGDKWSEEQREGNKFTLFAFRRRYEELLSGELDELTHPDSPIKIDGNPAIYGSGGWNRYFVLPNGEIVFSKRHARNIDDIHKAEQLKITTW